MVGPLKFVVVWRVLLKKGVFNLSLFQEHNEDLLKYDKEVFLVALEYACEDHINYNSDGRLTLKDYVEEYLKRAEETRYEWDLDLDDIDR